MDKEDIGGYIFDTVKVIAVTVITSILDVVEASFDCMTVSTGKQLLKVSIAVYLFIPLVIVLDLLKVNTAVNLGDALLASVIITAITAINNITDSQVRNSIESMKGIKEKVKKGVKRKNG